jgi:diguanylate cyclase (GGDEF)-like protein
MAETTANTGERSPALVLAAAVLAVTITGYVDWVTGYEIRVFPLYFLPVALVAWKHSTAAALGLSVLSTLAWLLSNWFAGRAYSSDLIWGINGTMQLISFVAIALLVAELRSRLAFEKSLSRTDALTGLLNSRAFQEQGGAVLAVAHRLGRPLTLAYLDLDNFKKVNDEGGHTEGDRALREVADVLKTLRRSDVVARLGGDEFAMLLPDTAAEAARRVLEQLREQVSVRMKRNGWPVTASVGAVAFGTPPPTLEQALRDADELMYRAKGGGKDRVHLEIATEPGPEPPERARRSDRAGPASSSR